MAIAAGGGTDLEKNRQLGQVIADAKVNNVPRCVCEYNFVFIYLFKRLRPMIFDKYLIESHFSKRVYLFIIYVYVYVCMHAYTNERLCVYGYICLYVYTVFLWIHLYMNIYIYIYIFVTIRDVIERQLKKADGAAAINHKS
jgi:hypothetical protein